MSDEILKIEQLFGATLPNGYRQFLLTLGNDVFDIENTGVCLYPIRDFLERNKTYSIQDNEPTAFMIGQDGDMGYFLKQGYGEQIFEVGLGALGSLEMRLKGDDIHDFIKNIELEWADD